MISTQTNTSNPAAKPASRRQIRAPFWSQAPWQGFTKHDHPRAEALVICPNARCRRSKTCAAAHDDLYCQRTHYSHAEHLVLHPQPKPQIPFDDDLDVRRERMIMQIEDRQAAHATMTARWQAGEFDGLYGTYHKRGRFMVPSPKTYSEERSSKFLQTSHDMRISTPNQSPGARHDRHS